MTLWEFTAACVERGITPSLVVETMEEAGLTHYPETIEEVRAFIDANF